MVEQIYRIAERSNKRCDVPSKASEMLSWTSASSSSIDVGGVRQLIDHAAVLGIEGRSVRLTGVRPGIMRIFQICLSTRPPNLRIEDPTGHDLASANGLTPGRSGAGALS